MTAPVAKPPIAVPDRGWAPDPIISPGKWPEYIKDQHGFAEIKPHNIVGIRDGLEQIADRYRTMPQECYLITYHYKKTDPLSLTAFVLEPKRPEEGQSLLGITPIRKLAKSKTPQPGERLPGQPRRESPCPSPNNRKDPAVQAWFRDLGTWHSLGTTPMPQLEWREWLAGNRGPQTKHQASVVGGPIGGPHRDGVGPQAFGAFAEVVLRDLFLTKFDPTKSLTNLTWNQLPSSEADAKWKEIAEYLYELANEIAVGSF